MVDAKASAYTTLWVLHFVVNILVEKCLVMIKHNFVVEQVLQLLGG